MSGRLNELADAFADAGLPGHAEEIRALQIDLDTIQRPQRRKKKRDVLKRTEHEVFAELRTVLDTMKDEGQTWASKQLGRLLSILEFEAEMRDEAWMGKELLKNWDKNENNQWEPNEIHAYQTELDMLRNLAEADAFIPRWFFMAEDAVYGPWPLSRVTGKRDVPPYLVRYGTDTGWVRLSDLVD